MKIFKLTMIGLAVLALIILLAGCSKPPKVEREAAKKAMDSALTANADVYASAEMETAKKMWDTAESRMKEKKYEEAKQHYIDARDAFEKAASAVVAGKKAALDQANETLKTLEGAWKKLDATARKMEKKLKDKKKEWTADAVTIKEGLQKAKEMIETSPVEAKTNLDELKPTIERWEDTFKQMTKSPTKHKTKTVKKKKK